MANRTQSHKVIGLVIGRRTATVVKIIDVQLEASMRILSELKMSCRQIVAHLTHEGGQLNGGVEEY